jgi:hypothetical protein
MPSSLVRRWIEYYLVMELSRTQLETLSEGERETVLKRLGAELTSRVLGAPDFDSEVEDIISELRARGHDLWLFDSDGEWQLWCGAWTKPEGEGGKLILHFDLVEGVEVSWSKPEG